MAWTDRVMTRLGLTLNRSKTCLRDARAERFNFLGYSFGPLCFRQTGRWFIGAAPSTKSVQRLKGKVGTAGILTVRSNAYFCSTPRPRSTRSGHNHD